MERTAEGLPAGGWTGGGRTAVVAGWAALGLAALVATWGVAPLLLRDGPDLAGLRPRADETPRAAAGSGGSTESPRRPPKPRVLPAGPLDLNRATADELTALPGIGPVMAARIVDHRRAVGPFPRVEALRGVAGIGPKRFERIAPHLAVDPRPPAAEPVSGGRDRPPAAEPVSGGREMTDTP